MRVGEIGMKVSSKEVLITKDGFVLKPFPKFTEDTVSNNRKTINLVKKIYLWLIDNAYQKALWKKDEFNQTQFKRILDDIENKIKPTISDKESAEIYLFEM